MSRCRICHTRRHSSHMNSPDVLQYGALGLLAIVLVGVGIGLKTLLARWLDQMDSGIKAQEASAGAMLSMANAMAALTTTVQEHALATMTEHRLLIDAVCKKLPAIVKDTLRTREAKATRPKGNGE